MVSRQVTVYTIFLALLCAHVRAQNIDNDLAKINNDLYAILGKKSGIASTPDEMEYNEEIDKVQMARSRNDGTTQTDKRNSLSAKLEAKRQFEYYENRRNELKETINKLLSLAENLNATSIVNSLKTALTQRNNFKEFAIATALEQLVAVNNGMPNNMIGGPVQPSGPSAGPSDLSNFLDILSKFVRSGGHLFSPTVYNQISPPSINSQSDNNLNQQLKDLLKKLNKRLASLSERDYDDWLEWFDW
ncbi:PREDICTED: uncharacterized protein LOC108971967 [Bactrocera latifrons]|uniref:uncharacterized protein LOC108971967 n=1 Tax=Bactrocera latifrons TaxID=174628 RepID=UPI0008DE20AA|nr:PREDICTED: uncharacterized protein LOC108971967 [Bactrocera latifrons]